MIIYFVFMQVKGMGKVGGIAVQLIYEVGYPRIIGHFRVPHWQNEPRAKGLRWNTSNLLFYLGISDLWVVPLFIICVKEEVVDRNGVNFNPPYS